MATRFLSRKETHQVCLRKHPEGLLLRGYEIHSGGHYQLATTGLCSLRDHARSDGHTHSDDRAPAPAVFGTLIKRDGRSVEVGDGAVSQAIRRAEFTAAKGTIATIYPTRGPKRLMIAGLGEAATFTSNAVRLATARIVRTAFAARVRRVRLEAMAGIGSKLDPEEAGHAIADGLAIAGFDFAQFKGAGCFVTAGLDKRVNILARA